MSHIAAILTGKRPGSRKDPPTQGSRGKKTALVRSLTAALGSVIDPGLGLFLTHFPKVSSSLATSVTS